MLGLLGLAPTMQTYPTRKPPLIGVTLDAEEPGGYSRFPWYAVRQNYMAAIASAGGVPIALPHLRDLAEMYIDTIDGLVVTGGAFDVDPALYGDHARHSSVTLKAERTAAEIALLHCALSRDVPVLGICGGEQLLAVVLGGTLIQHIPDVVPNALAHEQPNPRDQVGHAVTIIEGTRLASIMSVDGVNVQVNSAHHQAVADPGHALVVNAIAPDGVVEGIEAPDRRFCIGVQWHPEFLINPGDRRLFEAFIDAASAA